MTLYQLLSQRAKEHPQDPAVLGLERSPLSFSQLFELVISVGSQLRALGLGQESCVAIVLPNGPEMATAFLAVSSWTVSAPLNPAYAAQEFEFYLSDLKAEALVVEQGSDSVAIGVAERLGLSVVEIAPDGSGVAGRFSMASAGVAEPVACSASSESPALVLHTSGTTAKPKLVPLSQANLLASARHVAGTLKLTTDDRCLNIMPLFHIHGLVAAVLSSIYSAASIVCTPGFQAPRFFDWMKEFDPTWYTAVPTMHQAILLQATMRKVAAGRLRFIRSSSASLAPSVMNELEQLFRVPVIEAYGMTEAAHQMTCNPLPPRERKQGSVGLAAGPEVMVVDDDWQRLSPGQTGEVVVRGPNVTSGYIQNPQANAVSFRDGWFRTGDQGVMDSDGYLHLTGRLKEIINRGGEKISPREIDEVLLRHPAVAQAVTFALPDVRLGEDVACAVVLHSGQEATTEEIRAYAADTLASFKVPRHILFLEDIPKGPTGKLQRVGLAAKLGLETAVPSSTERAPEPPETAVEKMLAGIWEEVLRVKGVGRNESFLQLGGDSILMVQVHSRILDRLGLDLSFPDLFNAPALAEQAVLIEDHLLEAT
jgi:oxalate---CoA ligase